MGKGSNDESDGFIRYGTPLDPLSDEEDDGESDVYAKTPKPKKQKLREKEEAAIGPKGKHLVQNQIVTDEQGRRRFHGAFSGGFPAGYYNTVGSKDGWEPKTFVSSRSNRFDPSQAPKPEDYMDADDLGEFGIAHQSLRATSSFADATNDVISRKRKLDNGATSDPLTRMWRGMIAPAQQSIGVKILMKMGWRQGWGIGPRRMVPMTASAAKDSSRRNKWEDDADSSSGDDDGSRKSKTSSKRRVRVAPKDIESILMRPKIDTKGLGYFGIDPNAAAAGDELSLALILPKDMAVKRTNAPAEKTASVGHINLFDVPERDNQVVLSSSSKASSTGKPSKGIKGHAFGIGAFEEEDDDIYAVENVSKYDFQMGGDESDPLHGWTAPKSDKNAGKKKKNPNADRVDFLLSQSCQPLTLPGFSPASAEQKPQSFERLKVPRGFKTFHVFEKAAKRAFTVTTTDGKEVRHNLPISVRSALLGESLTSGPEKVIVDENAKTAKSSRWGGMSPATSSTPVVTPSTSSLEDDVIGPHPVSVDEPAGPKVIRVAEGGSFATSPASASSSAMPPPPAPPPPTTAPPKPSFLPTFVSATPASSGPSSSSPMTPPSVAANAAAGFSPFASDPTKNARYTAYLNRKKKGDKNPYRGLAAPHMTEWEKEREKEEFQRASLIYRPMSTTMSSRFVAAKFDDEDDSGGAVSKDEQVDMKNAVKMNMFGTITRIKTEWRPDRILCKRFNVPVPYGDESGSASDYSDSTADTEPKKAFVMKDLFANMTKSPSLAITDAASQPPTSDEGSSTSLPTFTSAFQDAEATGAESATTTSGVTISSTSSKDSEAPAMEEVFESDDVITRHLKNKRNEVAKIAIKIKSNVSAAYVPPGPTDRKEEEPSEPEEAKPDKDLFKAIFESDDDDDEDSSDEEEEEKEEAKKMEVTSVEGSKSAEVEGLIPNEMKDTTHKDNDKRKMLLERYGSVGENGGSDRLADSRSTSEVTPRELPTKITFSYSKSKKNGENDRTKILKPAAKMSFADDDEDDVESEGEMNDPIDNRSGSLITSMSTPSINPFIATSDDAMNADRNEIVEDANRNEITEEVTNDVGKNVGDDSDDGGDFGPSLPVDLENLPSDRTNDGAKVDSSFDDKKRDKKKKKRKSKDKKKKEKKKLKKSKNKKKKRHHSTDSDSSSSSS